MMSDTRADPIETARTIVSERFPHSRVALLAGSVIRGEATATSDLDLLVIDSDGGAPFRESFVHQGWRVEAFVQTPSAWRYYMRHDAERRMPSLAFMTSEGMVLRDQDGTATAMKQESQFLLERGPEPLSAEELLNRRYAVTDLLDDFEGSEPAGDGLLTAGLLVQAAGDLFLASQRQWSGRGKWMFRALRRVDVGLADALREGLAAYGLRGDKAPLTVAVRETLTPVGGPLFQGYRVEGREE